MEIEITTLHLLLWQNWTFLYRNVRNWNALVQNGSEHLRKDDVHNLVEFQFLLSTDEKGVDRAFVWNEIVVQTLHVKNTKQTHLQKTTNPIPVQLLHIQSLHHPLDLITDEGFCHMILVKYKRS